MSVRQSNITMKGTKDGLVLQMNDTCAFQELLHELEVKLERDNESSDQPAVHVIVQLGNRYVTKQQADEMKKRIQQRGNLVVERLESNVVSKEEFARARDRSDVQIISHTVRSGQVVSSTRNVLILGDVNPGAFVCSSGSIFVLGTLRGMVHAGEDSNEEAIVVAAMMRPSQLRIAEFVASVPEHWDVQSSIMRMAFVHGDGIRFAPNSKIKEIRPNLMHIHDSLLE